jgi:hypothetical protein
MGHRKTMAMAFWAIPSDTWDEVERSGSDAAEFKPQRWMDMEVDSVTGCAKSR